MLFQNAERKALAVRGLEDVVHREEVRARIDSAIEAMAHGAHEEGGLEEREIEIRALALAHAARIATAAKAPPAMSAIGSDERAGGLQPLARKGERAGRGDVVDVVARPLAPRAGLAIAGDRAVDELGRYCFLSVS